MYTPSNSRYKSVDHKEAWLSRLLLTFHCPMAYWTWIVLLWVERMSILSLSRGVRRTRGVSYSRFNDEQRELMGKLHQA